MLDILADFGTRVRELRLRSGMSQEVLAYHAGLDRTYLSGVERGDRNVSLRNIERISAALNITVSYLFSDERFSTTPAYVSKDFQTPLSERFAYHVDYENKIVAWQVNGVLSGQETETIGKTLLMAVSYFNKGEVSAFVDHREMKANGEPIVYSLDVVAKAIEFQKRMMAYCDKVAVLCNSNYMVTQLNQVAQTSGVIDKASHIYGKDRNMVDQAYQLLNIHGNDLIKVKEE